MIRTGYRMFNVGLILVALLNLVPASAGASDGVKVVGQIRTSDFRTIVDRIVLPVVQARANYVEIEERAAEGGAKANSKLRRPTLLLRTVRVQSGFREVLGSYEIHVVADPRVVEGHILYADASQLGVRRITDGDHSYKQVYGVLDLSTKMIEPASFYEAQGSFRSLLPADPLVNPQSIPVDDPDKFELSPPQMHIIKQLRTFESQAIARQEPLRVMILMPTGLGKTLMALKWIEERWQRQPRGQRSRVIFILQDREVLRRLGQRFIQVLHLSPTAAFIQPNNLNRADLIAAMNSSATRRFFVTRSFAAANLDLFQREASRGALDIIPDEAHHVGNFADDEDRALLRDSGQDVGEFQRFFEGIGPYLRPGSQILGLSATPWHKKSDVLERYFGGHLATAFLTEPEKARFVQDRDYVNLARVITLRAMAQGYLSPIYSYTQNLFLDDQTRALDFLRRSGDFVREFANEKDQTEALAGQITVHEPFVRLMYKDIDATIEGAENFVRGMIFVPSIAHANIYAQMLNEMATKNRLNVRFQAFHSKLADEDREPALNWFQDQRSSGEAMPKTSHKYILVVRALTEGFDSPDVNHLLFARPVSTDDLVGMRILLQGLGRGLRIAPYKPQLSLHDYTGRVFDLLFGELDPLLLNRILLRPKLARQVSVAPVVVVDRNSVSEKDFVRQQVPVEPALAQAFRQEEGDAARLITETNPRWYREVVVPQSLAPLYGWPFSSRELDVKFQSAFMVHHFAQMLKMYPKVRLDPGFSSTFNVKPVAGSKTPDPTYCLDDIWLSSGQVRPEKLERDQVVSDAYLTQLKQLEAEGSREDASIVEAAIKAIRQMPTEGVMDHRPVEYRKAWPGEIRVLGRPDILGQADLQVQMDASFSESRISDDDFKELTREQDFGPYVAAKTLFDIYLQGQPKQLSHFMTRLLSENDPRAAFIRYALIKSTKSRAEWMKMSPARLLTYQSLYLAKELPLVTRTTPDDGPIVGLSAKVLEDVEQSYKAAFDRLQSISGLIGVNSDQVSEVIGRRYRRETGRPLAVDLALRRIRVLASYISGPSQSEQNRLIVDTNPYWYDSKVYPNSVLPVLAVPTARYRLIASRAFKDREFNQARSLADAYKVDPATRIGQYNKTLGEPDASRLTRMDPSVPQEGFLAIMLQAHFNVAVKDISRNPPTRPMRYYPESFDVGDPQDGSESPRKMKGRDDPQILQSLVLQRGQIKESDLDFYQTMIPVMVEKMYLKFLGDYSPRARLIRYAVLRMMRPTVVDVLLAVTLNDNILKLKVAPNPDTLEDAVEIDPEFLDLQRTTLQYLIGRVQSYGLPFGRDVDRKAVAKDVQKRLKSLGIAPAPVESENCSALLSSKKGK